MVFVEAVAAVDSSWQFQQVVVRESDDSGIGYGLSITGHVIIALLLMFGVLERIDLFPVSTIPVEIVLVKSAEAARPSPPASPPAVSAVSEQTHPSGILPVDDVDKHAKAPLAALNVNGIDRPKQPGNDGRDPSVDQAGIPHPPTFEAAELASGGASASSRVVVTAPIGPAPPQMTAREPGEDEWNAIKEQKISCGIMAKYPIPKVVTQEEARVKGFATEAQALAIIRRNQNVLDRHVSANYFRNQRLFVESLDGARRFIVVLPSGLTVNVGDVIRYDQHHVDPSDSCQFIPPLAVSKL